MDIDTFKTTWQRQPVSGAPQEDIETMIGQLESRLGHYHRRLFWRDVREIGTAFLVLGVLAACTVATLGDDDPMVQTVLANPATASGAIVIAIGCLWVIGVLLHARWRGRDRERSEALPVHAHLEAERARIDDQIHLLQRVGWWYLAPLLVGAFILFVGVTSAIPTEGAQSLWKWLAIAGYGLFLGLFGWFLWNMNQKAASKQLVPLREDVDRCLTQLTKGV